MSSYPRWKYFLVLLVLLTSFIYSLPNLYQSSPAIEISLNDSTQIQDIIKKLNQPEDKVIYKDKKVILTFNDSVSQLKAYDNLRTENSKYNYMKNGTPILTSMPYNDSILVLHSF